MKCSLVSLIFLKRSLVFPILLFSSISLHWSPRNAFFTSPCYSLELCIRLDISYLLLCFSLLFFTQLFVKPPQTTILPFFISFSWGWLLSWSPAQCYKPPSIGLQALCLSDLITELGLPQMTAYLWSVLQKCKTKSFKLFIPFNSNITFAGFKEIILFICKNIAINCSFQHHLQLQKIGKNLNIQSYVYVCVCVCVCVCACTLSHSVMSNSLGPIGLQPSRLLCPWDFPVKNTEVGCHFLLQGTFLIQGLDSTSPASPILGGRFFTTEPPGKPFKHIWLAT